MRKKRSRDGKLNFSEYFQGFIDGTNTCQWRNVKGQIIRLSKAYKVTLNNLKAFNFSLGFNGIDVEL